MVIEYFLSWVENASPAKRLEAATALARAYLRDDLSFSERDDIEAAITTLLEDPAPQVRDALAEVFGAHENVPRHIINALAMDCDDIACKILSQSPIFLDQELIHIIKNSNVAKQISIACRYYVSQDVLSAICEFASEDACLAALMNRACQFNEENLHMLAGRFGNSTEIRLILMDRTDLATKTKLLLINKLGSALHSLVTEKSWLSEFRASSVVSDACDKACIAFAANAPEQEVVNVVKSLIEHDKISVAFMLRAVCMGNITLAAAAFAELSGVRLDRIETILSNDRRSAFKAVYDRAGLPQSAYPTFQCAISSWRKLLREKTIENEERLPFLVTKEVLRSYQSQSNQSTDELLVLLRKLAAETARACAKYKAIEISHRAPSPAAAVQQPVNQLEHTPLIEEVPDLVQVVEMASGVDEPTSPPVQEARGEKQDAKWDAIFDKIGRLTEKKPALAHEDTPIIDQGAEALSIDVIDINDYLGDVELAALEESDILSNVTAALGHAA